MKKAGDVDEQPDAYDDAQHGRLGEQEIWRSGMPIPGRVESTHRIFLPIILARWRGPTTDVLTDHGSLGVGTDADLYNEPSVGGLSD